jgi:hypothetical protein
VCHPPVGHPPLGGSVAGAAQVVALQDTIESQPSDGATGGNRVPVSGAAAAMGAAAQVVTGGGSLASEVLPEGDTNVTVEEVAAGDPVGSTGPTGDASSSTVAVDGCATVESEFILGHPMLRLLGMFPLTRPWVWPTGHLPRLRTCSIGRVEASSMNDDAYCCGLPCSRSGQRQRGQGWR